MIDMFTRKCKVKFVAISFNFLSCALLVVFLGSQTKAGELLLTKQDIVEVEPSFWAAIELTLPKQDTSLQIVGPRNSQHGVRLLRFYNSQRDINAFRGVIYDNRDRGHSPFDPALYPRLTHLKYDADLVSGEFDFGLAGRILFPAVVLGNSSAALERSNAPRSLPRLAMTNAFWRSVTPILYSNNHIYIYPEHRDHDADDRFPVNWPYMVTSQGSSGSDQRFLSAIALTLAALPHDTFEFLRAKGLIAPTIQMILRRNLKTVSDRADYLSGVAHPAAFDRRLIQSGRMVADAADLRPEDIPPLVKLRVVEEDFAKAAGLAGLDERLVDSPAAIGRLWRGFTWERELVVTAEDTIAPNDRPFAFEWRLLRGDPDLVQIEPQGHDGLTAKIRIAWHEPWTEVALGRRGDISRRMSRVDIGVFANNGVHDSAPSFISIDFPEHQIRNYVTLTNGEKRLSSIDYDAKGRGSYFDPLLYWSAAWTDTARYDSDNTLIGWDRLESDGESEGFVRHEPDAATRLYEISRRNSRQPILKRIAQ